MNIKRILAIVAVFGLACGGWFILGSATFARSHNFSQRLGGMVEGLYGSPLAQQAPTFGVQIPGTDQMRWLMPSKNAIQVKLTTDYRRKGLIWYPTFICEFAGDYTLTNEEETALKVRLHYDFPAPDGSYNDFEASIDGQAIAPAQIDPKRGIDEIMEVAPGESRTFHVSYDTGGLGSWHYLLDPNLGQVQNLNLTAQTNFEKFDYPEGSWSATKASAKGDGMELSWTTSNRITARPIGVIIPEKLNPGPLITRITFFAPVCLLFFFVLVMTINILYRVNIHPMHYLFVAAGFFAFHLLLSYLADVVNIHVAFIAAALVSVGLVTSYLTAALRGEFPWKVAVAGQLFFLVLFSYSFFLKGMTGLTVAIGSVITLAVLMRVTAHLDWNEVFARPGRKGKGETLPGQPLSATE